MNTHMQDKQEVMYCPAIAITRITAKQTLGRVPFVLLNQPEQICGVAKRVGYTGREETDLALYRLKLQTKRGRMEIMIPSLFVVDGGIFLDYECWRSLNKQEGKEKAMQRILVIDDTQDILDLFRTLLEEEGYEVHLSASVPENLAEIEHIHPDLIILDFMMGKYQEGWRTLQKLTMFRATASIPLMLCTAALQEVREQETYLEQKGIQVVFKPFEIDDLLDAVHQAIESRPPSS